MSRQCTKCRIDLDQRHLQSPERARQSQRRQRLRLHQARPCARSHARTWRQRAGSRHGLRDDRAAAGAREACHREWHLRWFRYQSSSGRNSWPRPASSKSLPRAKLMLVGDKHATWQHAERTLKHAHVLVKDHRNGSRRFPATRPPPTPGLRHSYGSIHACISCASRNGISGCCGGCLCRSHGAFYPLHLASNCGKSQSTALAA